MKSEYTPQAFLRNLIQYRYVLNNLVTSDIKVKYRGTVFGYLWSLLEPLAFVLIYWFVFVIIARRGDRTYSLQVILGVLPFQFFSNVVSGGASALVGNASLIRRVYMPREIFIFSTLVSNLVVLLTSLLVVIPFLIAYQVTPGWRIVYVLLGILLLSLFSLGIVMILACFQAFYRDIAYVIRVVLRLAMYLSPVIYSMQMVPEHIRIYYVINPLSIYISLIRSGVMNWELLFNEWVIVYAIICALASFRLGLWGFGKMIDRAVKYL